MLVAHRPVAGAKARRVQLNVRPIEVRIVVLVYRHHDQFRPRRLDHEHILNAVPLELLPHLRVQDDRLGPEEWRRRRSRLHLGGSGGGADDDPARLRLLEHAATIAHWRRFADTPQDVQRADVVVLDIVLAEAAQELDRGRRRVELRGLVFVDCLPLACGRCRHEHRFEHRRRHAARQWADTMYVWPVIQPISGMHANQVSGRRRT